MDLRPRVLVVDDDLDFRECMAEVLSSRGASVTVAGSGAEALTRLAGDPLPNLVLLDVRMPQMDGRAVLKSMRADPRLASVPIIAVTAAEPDDLGVPCLVKPFDLSDLLDLVAQVLRDGPKRALGTAAGPGRIP